ncbi:MAG: hypothetical protein QG608_705 [Actinomycetota bacterium]|nr:hypothetical protein [Actinomycetota bacterium]
MGTATNPAAGSAFHHSPDLQDLWPDGPTIGDTGGDLFQGPTPQADPAHSRIDLYRVKGGRGKTLPGQGSTAARRRGVQGLKGSPGEGAVPGRRRVSRDRPHRAACRPGRNHAGPRDGRRVRRTAHADDVGRHLYDGTAEAAVDESFRHSRSLLAATLVSPSQVRELRTAVRRLFLPGKREQHRETVGAGFSSSTDLQRPASGPDTGPGGLLVHVVPAPRPVIRRGWRQTRSRRDSGPARQLTGRIRLHGHRRRRGRRHWCNRPVPRRSSP